MSGENEINRVYYCSECNSFKERSRVKDNYRMECNCGEHMPELSSVELLNKYKELESQNKELDKRLLDTEEAILSLRKKILTLDDGEKYSVSYLRAGEVVQVNVSK